MAGFFVYTGVPFLNAEHLEHLQATAFFLLVS